MSASILPLDRGRLREEIRTALADPTRTAELLGLAGGGKREANGGFLVRCPAHEDARPSCSLTRGPDGTLRARCFACGFSGDVFSLVAATRGLDVRRDFGAVVTAAAELAGLDQAAYSARPPSAPASRPSPLGAARTGESPRPAPTPALKAPATPLDDLGPLWRGLPPAGPDAWEYLRTRGLHEAADLVRGVPPEGRTAAFAGQGYALAAPLRDPAGRIVAVQLRSLRPRAEQGTDDRFRALGPTSAGVFGDPARLAEARNVVVAEGMTDWLAAELACRAARVTVPVGIAGCSATAGLLGLVLAGKRVLLAHDADRAGDEAAAALMEPLRRLGAVPLRARPYPDGADLSAMTARGEDVGAFLRRTLVEASGFRAAASRLVGEREERLAIGPRVRTLGVRFLDLALGGIFPGDLILVGGASGQGKTELARLIAQANVDQGKRVHYFALEAEPREIERRAKYARLADRLLSRVGSGRYYERLNYLDWYAGRIDDLTGPHEAEVDREIAERLSTLYTHYPDDSFDIGAFETSFRAVADESDLVVLDHFHYLDFGEQENRAAKAAIKRLRRLTLETGVPILVVAHIRKADRGGKRLIPVLEDFHGSSDVVKIATKAVLLAAATDRQNTAPHLWKTYLSAGKCRIEGARSRYAACVVFDARRRAYDEDFILGTVSPGGDKFSEVEEWPAWARASAPAAPSNPAPPTETDG